MDLVYFIFFLVRAVRVFITPLLSIHLPPYIATTIHYHYIPFSAIGEVVHSSVHDSLHPFVSFPNNNNNNSKNSFLKIRFIYHPRCW
jgi:hypothetical protein